MFEKLILLSLVVSICILIFHLNNRSLSSRSFTYLALGDSYTIGEGVAIYESFPYQAVQLLRKGGFVFNAPEIVAQTGWTTGDLKKGVKATVLQGSYDMVSLLIGVNNQYRNLPVTEYAVEFEQLLRQAITLAANKADHVVVFSIPDWSVTPFAGYLLREKIADEITAFNRVNEEITHRYQATYISIMEGSRRAETDNSLLAPDALHPSGKLYASWASAFAEEVFRLMNR